MRRKARSSVKAIFLLCSVSHVNPESLDGLEVTSAPDASCKLTHAFSTPAADFGSRWLESRCIGFLLGPDAARCR